MGKSDLESGDNNAVYPMMHEPPEFRWAFIRKVYTIISVQLLLTAGVASIVVFNPAIPNFIKHTKPGLAVFIISLILPLILMCPLRAYHKCHPLNFILLALFTASFSFGVGLSCSYTKGRIVLEAVTLTAVMVVGLTLYTFWAVKRGQDFGFLGPFLFGSLLVLLVFGLIQVFFPLGKTSHMVYGCLAAIIFCGFIVYDTNEMIKRYSYDDYIWAAVALYMDIVNLFLAILSILKALE